MLSRRPYRKRGPRRARVRASGRSKTAASRRRCMPVPRRFASGKESPMAMEMHVLFSRARLPDKRALSRAMSDLGFPLTIAAGSLERQSGFMPMRLRREETGVEFDVWNDRATVEELAGKDVDP